ncbi:MAG: hypothetical protein ACR2N0_06815 [Rubrobacteraceae bacterium]
MPFAYTPAEAPAQIYERGDGHLRDEAKDAARIPPGHPEAFIDVYGAFARDVRSGVRSGFPTIYDVARGVRFTEKSGEREEMDGLFIFVRRVGSMRFP